VVHWPVPFPPGRGVFPKDANGDVEIDTTVTLVETWKKFIELPKTGKVGYNIDYLIF
jgi:L-glyceraldehyde reductase